MQAHSIIPLMMRFVRYTQSLLRQKGAVANKSHIDLVLMIPLLTPRIRKFENSRTLRNAHALASMPLTWTSVSINDRLRSCNNNRDTCNRAWNNSAIAVPSLDSDVEVLKGLERLKA